MSHFVYALYNKESNKIYIGETSNIERRLKEHNQKLGNHFTAKAQGEWKLIYREELLGKVEATTRERELKSYRGRQFVKSLI